MKTLFISLIIATAIQANAQPAVQNFSLTNVVTGSALSLDNFKTHPGIVVWFTCQSCPFDGYYRDRLSALVNAYGSKVQFLLVNSCVEAEESAEKMKAFHASTGLSIPYLEDKNQTAMNALGAKKSPEVFLLRPVVSGGYQVWYSGAIDDNAQSPSAVTVTYLKSAIDNLLAGKPAGAPQRPVGCTIKSK